MYQVRFTAEAHADVKSLPKNVNNSLKKEIRKLAADPVGPSRELRGNLKGLRSYHWRNYRIIFMVLEDIEIIAITAVGRRIPGTETDVYRELERLAREGKLAQRILAALRGFTD